MFNWRLTFVCDITIIYRSAKILLSSSECSYIGCTRISINVQSVWYWHPCAQPVYEHSDEPAPGQKTTNWISPRILPSPRVSTARIRRYSKRNCFTESHWALEKFGRLKTSGRGEIWKTEGLLHFIFFFAVSIKDKVIMICKLFCFSSTHTKTLFWFLGIYSLPLEIYDVKMTKNILKDIDFR